MKSTSPTDRQPRRIDKALFEAGLQCGKRLYLDARENDQPELSESRQLHADAGKQLIELARSAFPKGVAVAGEGVDELVASTKELLAGDAPILFGATFCHDEVVVTTDILLRQRDGSVDIYEVKSGTKVKQRYLLDLALQVYVLEQSGLQVRATFVLHLNARYTHTGESEYLVQQLLKSADVTSRVRRQRQRLEGLLQTLRHQLDDESTMELPTGTWCTQPFTCPHLDRCSATSGAHPLRELPDLTRDFEATLHTEAIEAIGDLDSKRAGLSFRQRRTIQCVQQNTLLVEPFVREELRQVDWPLHIAVSAAVTEALPRFKGQRPWRMLPYAWSVQTLHEDGRVEEQSFVHADKDDPRLPFVQSLAAHIDAKGTLLCWGCEQIDSLRHLLEELPEGKAAVRTLLARPHFDALKLFESGVFHPDMRGRRDLHTAAHVLIDDQGDLKLTVADDDQVLVALKKAASPRVRAATKEKLGGEVLALLRWRSLALASIYRRFAEFNPKPADKPKAQKAGGPRKALPKEGSGPAAVE